MVSSWCERKRVSLWYSPSLPGASTWMSPKRSNMAKVWSFFRTCGCSSVLAAVAATYHLSPIWIFCGMRCLPFVPGVAERSIA